MVDHRLFVLLRGDVTSEQQLLCVFNLSKDSVMVNKDDLGLATGVNLESRFSRGEIIETPQALSLSPYAMAWLEWVV